jgi:hypothetical protein
MIMPSPELALVEQYPPVAFSTLPKLKKMIASQFKKLSDGSENQHLSISGISPRLFNMIEESRLGHGNGIRLTYFGDIETLIIKLVSRAHEKAHRLLGSLIQRTILPMGIAIEEFCGLGSSTCRGQNASAKEADSSWINYRIRPNTGDWPCFVIETGVSESMPRLRSDARWWIEHSAGAVNLVLLIWIRPAGKKVKMEKWIPGPAPTTRRSPRFAQNIFPTCTAEISIDQSQAPSIIQGAPLVLEFAKLFDRAAILPLEADLSFTSQDLDQWANWLWVGI